MPRAYVSSTFNDLRDHRQVAIATLETLGCRTSAMERYFASDDRPLDVCLRDLERCDLYIGIFAWRYGTIVAGDNPERKSITECELREAMQLGIPCLIFLSDDDRDKWPIDGAEDVARVDRLRRELSEWKTVARFDSPDKLGLEISKAVFQWLNWPDFSRYREGLVEDFAELPELPDQTRNLSLQDIMPVVVTMPPALTSSGEPRPQIVDLAQAVDYERSWVLVGEGGAGKTTALRYLAHYAASRTPLIPVYIPLSSGRTPLRERIWTALQRPGFRCSNDLVDAWVGDKPFLFLVDQLEDSDARATLEELKELMRRAPNARLVVASRPASFLDGCAWPQARIVPPSDSSLRSFLRILLGPERGATMFNVLAQNGVLEPFRRPLFARLVALSSPELLDGPRLTLGEVFRDVLEGRFLRKWERQPESRVESDLIRDLIVAVAYEMIRAETHALARDAVLRHGADLARSRGLTDVRTVEKLVDRLIRNGLVTESGQGLRFWHTSFRDYFAAIRLERHANGLTIYLRSWQPRWHECLVFYYGFLRGRLLERRLGQLLTGLRVMIGLLSINPIRSVSSRVIFVLRCLVQARESTGRWRERFIRRLPGPKGDLFLGGSEERYRYFCYLIGQLRTPEGFAYLRASHWPLEIVAPGLMHDPDDESVERLVAALSDPEAHFTLARLLLMSPQERCFESLQCAIQEEDDVARLRILSSLTSALGLLTRKEDQDLMPPWADRWMSLLTDLALHDADEEVRRYAVRFLRNFGEGRTRLPLQAHETFVLTLSDSSEEMRERALNALSPPELKNEMEIVWRLLNDESLSIVFGALFHFRICATAPRFCHAVLKVIRRYEPAGSTVRNVAIFIHDQQRQNGLGGGVPLRCVALLMSAGYLGTYKGLQLFALGALAKLRIDWTVRYFIEVLWSKAWEEARRSAFYAVRDLMGADARPHIIRGLEDEAAGLRFDAAAECFLHAGDDAFRRETGPILFRLLNDESENVRRYAWLALKEYGYLAKDWYPSMGEPAYLGPAEPATSSL